MDWIIRFLLLFLRIIKGVKHGDFDVVGSGSVSICLGDYRRVVDVHFVEDGSYPLPPCGGGVGDTLKWEIVKHRKHGKPHYTLDVKWSVNRPRRFVWLVSWR